MICDKPDAQVLKLRLWRLAPGSHAPAWERWISTLSVERATQNVSDGRSHAERGNEPAQSGHSVFSTSERL